MSMTVHEQILRKMWASRETLQFLWGATYREKIQKDMDLFCSIMAERGETNEVKLLQTILAEMRDAGQLTAGVIMRFSSAVLELCEAEDAKNVTQPMPVAGNGGAS